MSRCLPECEYHRRMAKPLIPVELIYERALALLDRALELDQPTQNGQHQPPVRGFHRRFESLSETEMLGSFLNWT